MSDDKCPICGAAVRVVTSGEGTSYYDPDYSPTQQDEYQRLWHETADKLRVAEQALKQVEVADAKTPVMSLNRIASDGLAALALPSSVDPKLLKDALAAYRSALRSGEPETDRLRALGDKALGLEGEQ